MEYFQKYIWIQDGLLSGGEIVVVVRVGQRGLESAGFSSDHSFLWFQLLRDLKN